MSSDWASGLIYTYICTPRPITPTIVLRILLSGFLGRNEDFDVIRVTPCSSHVTFNCVDAFLTTQDMLLMLRHMRRAFIEFLWLYVPYDLRCDADPTAEELARTWTGIFLLVTLFFDINTS